MREAPPKTRSFTSSNRSGELYGLELKRREWRTRVRCVSLSESFSIVACWGTPTIEVVGKRGREEGGKVTSLFEGRGEGQEQIKWWEGGRIGEQTKGKVGDAETAAGVV